MREPKTVVQTSARRHGSFTRTFGALASFAAVLVGLGLSEPSVRAATSGNDYHLDAFGDPMDFSNPEDLVLDTDEAMFVGGTNKSISGGQLHFDTSGPFQFDPVWTGFPTGIPHDREGDRVPIDADHYRRFIVRMNAPEGAPIGLRWFNCPAMNAGCQGGQAFWGRGGWQTYDVSLGLDGTVEGMSVPWSGKITGLRFVGTVAGHFDVDWIRLVPSDLRDVQELTGAAPPDAHPNDRLDWPTWAGNAWDMDALTDIQTQVHLQPGATASGGRFHACNVPVNTGKEGDPGMQLNMPGGRTIDANRFKTLTFEYSYDGSFSARTVPGGGMVARVFWFDAKGRHPSQGIHLYPNERVVQIRLDDPAQPFPGIEPGKGVATGAPWQGTVTGFRLDPNQDPGGRCFTIGRVWLTADEPAGELAPPARLALVSTDPASKAVKVPKAKAKR